jgi:hypothetical protein
VIQHAFAAKSREQTAESEPLSRAPQTPTERGVSAYFAKKSGSSYLFSFTNSPSLVLCTRTHLGTASFGFVLAQDTGGARENAFPQIYGGDDFGAGT